jgi:hypothetical protein
MTSVMKRRAFLGTLAGGLLAAPLAAGAQPPGKVYRIGYLDATTARVPFGRSGKGCASSGGSGARISPSSIDLGRVGSTGYPTSRPSWSGSRWTSS